MTTTTDQPQLLRNTMLSCQICVPKSFTDEEATIWVNSDNPAGTSNGWNMRKDGDEALAGAPERAQCSERPDCCHIMFDC